MKKSVLRGCYAHGRGAPHAEGLGFEPGSLWTPALVSTPSSVMAAPPPDLLLPLRVASTSGWVLPRQPPPFAVHIHRRGEQAASSPEIEGLRREAEGSRAPILPPRLAQIGPSL